MKELQVTNFFNFIKEYFISIGMEEEAEELLTAKKFTKALVLKLPQVCVISSNRPKGTPGNQTHIHVTGDNRFLFFTPEEIELAEGTTDDRKQNLIVLKRNIENLPNGKTSSKEKEIKTHTMIKLGHGKDKQVQISKIRQDGQDFINLRKGLYENDLLIFLKARSSDEMLALGIPYEYYQDKIDGKTMLFEGLESKEVVTIKTVLNTVSDVFNEFDVVSSDEVLSDAIYQELVNAAEASTTSYAAEKYISAHPEGKSVKTTRPTTNPALGKEAIKDAGYCCAVNEEHETFIKKNGEKYLEVHHLIPLERQSEFENKLDTKANLVSICPLCHKKIHYGRIEDIEPIIKKLFEERKEHLKTSGIEISFEKLMEYYE